MNIKELSIEQLKALWFDEYKIFTQSQNNLTVLAQEIDARSKVETKNENIPHTGNKK